MKQNCNQIVDFIPAVTFGAGKWSPGFMSKTNQTYLMIMNECSNYNLLMSTIQ